VAAAAGALVVGAVVLARRKGDAWHVGTGRVYVATMLVVSLPVLLVYDTTGRPGPFHVLAVVSLATTALGWRAARRRGGDRRRAVAAHATLMSWSWIGVVTAGLAQLANARWPERSPWPVLAVIGLATAAGALSVGPLVSRALRRRPGARTGAA
jgi:uncharacterized membrane protein